MKKILLIISTIFLFASCQQRQPQYRTEDFYNDQGQRVVYVQQPDGHSYFLDYLIYSTLFKQGGYNSVNNYYTTNQSSISANTESYRKTYYPKSSNNQLNKQYYTKKTSSYTTPISSTSKNSYTTPKSSTKSSSYTTPKQKTSTSSYTTPTTKKSYSTPSSSYKPSSSTYKSSSSYSTPKSSYSSPSRSYSSPKPSSRSYSSPNRH